ncbi:MAG: DNA polymerase III subunit alpha [Bacteroidetes bacterium]|nr:MAG: DNA polymerase III subunit alpha [Bacteroidota bacterium]REK06046.1 MAG: DNA polymerase III subunit alpha [Bacteroidota bacterium]REK37104.1 MAG: DNA polymerase III subunit alpha [Bacteroidota bacterium]REK47503.1 MAG: DNA polymerase III subunit alpha [Bacteroidota bacterium]
MPAFSHLHVHTQFSLLDGAADISSLYKKAVADNMPAIAITDHGNMFGAFKFVAEAGKHNTKENPNRIKPVVGCEFYLVEDRTKKQFTRDDRDQRHHQLFLAKNAEGYRNLVKLCSLGYIEGLYGKYPRIDKELVQKYHKGLIATTCCLGASVPKTILKKGEAEGEKEFLWWLDLFGEDYYIEIQRHDIPEQEKVNAVLLKWAEKYNVKVIASNDSHYVNQEDYNAHDILLCINTGEKQSTPTMKEFSDDESISKGKRFAFYNDQFYFKTTEEMSALFHDIPEAIDNTNDIVSKIEPLRLKQDILLPHYTIPKEFASQDEYLKHITWEGARSRYKEITPEIEERINFELFTIRTMGFDGYFLIVADFIRAGRDLGVFVGPGRGSAAGSVVAYCIGITNIDPIKYNLLFERFLNPDRKSMPDIDTDFDDAGRQKVIDYVVNKYGKNQVAQIVTYGTMAAKMSIKDVARVMDLPLPESNELAKLVPERPGIELKRVLQAPLEGNGSLKDKENLNSDEIELVKKLRDKYKGEDLASRVLKEALVLEGSVRNTGIHAAGIIIAPKDLTEIIPVATSKDTDLLITQFEGKIIEDAGVIKMDFLGLKTLTIIKDALVLIEENHGVKINIDEIPLDDKKTFELYQRGETNGTFQFESAGMQKYLKDLKPDKFEDLIAMNALFRPGPLEYIPDFIARKHGRQAVKFDLPEMEEHLRETYGITVYQEQVMLLSQKLANFTKGDADTLRKAMGKKQKEVLDKMKSKFMDGCRANNHDPEKCEKIWTDWEAFASYAFNKSHSTCYAFVAFQTAYLKAHYPAEYMSSVLTHNLSNIDKITFFMEECRRMNIPVLGPDVNESLYNFAVNNKGQIRFGLGAVKGVGENAVNAIIEERKNNGPFSDIFDLTSRVNSKGANKKCLESLAASGSFDCFENVTRAQYLCGDLKDPMTGIERAIRFGNAVTAQQTSIQNSLFGDTAESHVAKPSLPQCEAFTPMEQLKREKEVIGFYISGHPLDDYKFEIRSFCSNRIEQLSETDKLRNKEVSFAGMLTDVQEKFTKAQKPYANITVEDFSGSITLSFFGEDYRKFREYFVKEAFVFIRAKVQPRFNSPDQFEVRPYYMQYLSDVSDKLAKSLTLKFPLQELDKDLLSRIEESLNNSPGNCVVKFSIIDKTSNINLDLPSKKMKVSVNKVLIENLDRLSCVEYKLN